MRRALAPIIMTVLAFALSIPVPTAALAAEKPLAWETVDVTLHSEQGSSVLLISGKLADSVKLPATVRLAAPAGGQLQWAGEILDGPPENDPAVEPTIENAGDSDWYTFTLTESRVGQIEVVSADSLKFDGHTYSASVTWDPPVDTALLRVNVMVPPGASVGAADEGLETVPGPNGFTYMRRSVQDAKPGEPVSASVSYTLSSAPAQGSASSSSSVFIVLLVVFALVGSGAVIALRNKARGRAADDSSIELEDEYDDAPSVEAVAASSARDGKSVAAATDDDDDDDITDASPRKRINPIVVAVVAVFLFAGAFAVSVGSRGVSDEGGLSMQYGGQDECATTIFAVEAPGNGDLERDAQALLESLRSVAGLSSGRVDLQTKTITVGYCGSVATPDQIAAALQTTGYAVSPTQMAPAPAPTPAPEATPEEPPQEAPAQ